MIEVGSAHGQLSGRQLQPREIAALAHQVGWHDVYLCAFATAVCLAESQGWDHASNDNLRTLSSLKPGDQVANPETYQPYTVVDPQVGIVRLADGTVEPHPPESGLVTSRDAGLWEINIPAWHIGSREEHDLYDPLNNARAAAKIWRIGGWARWASVAKGVVYHDYYAARACLGVFNYAASQFDVHGATLTVPIFTLAELHKKVGW